MPAVNNFLLQHQFHQLFGGWGHILEALTKRNDRKAHTLQVLHHLHSAPAVECNFPDVEAFTQAFNELFNVTVVNDIAFRGLEVSLALPHIVWHMVAPDAEVEVVLRNPEVRQDAVFVAPVFRREYQDERRNVRCGGQVQANVADTTFQIVLADSEFVFVSLIHRHPAYHLFDPLV